MPKLLSLLLLVSLVSLSMCFPFTTVYADNQTTSPIVTLSKVASSDNATLGDNVTYTYTIINNSTDNITNLMLEDDKIGTITLPVELAAGGNVTATGSYIVLMSDYNNSATELVNIATVTGVLSSGENVTATATETITLNMYSASLQITKEADTETALLDDEITYTYTVTNNGKVEISGISLTDDKLGAIPLISDNVTVTNLEPNESVAVTATYKVVLKDLIAGSIKNIATVKGTDPQGVPVTDSSGVVTVYTKIIKTLLNKAEILKLSGVPGKGIDKAPGLQKPFNHKSQASEHAGKKDTNGNKEQNTNMEMNGNAERNRHQELNRNIEQNQEQEMNQNTEQNGKKQNNKNKEHGNNNPN